MAVIVLLSLPLGWFGWKMREAERQRRAVEAVRKAGGVVYYNYQQWDDSASITVEEPPHPACLRRLVGDDFLSDVVGVGYCYSEEVSDVLLGHLNGLTTLEFLDLYETHVTDVGLENVEGLTRLEWLDLSYTQVRDTGLGHLRGLTKLKHLNLNDTHVTDTGLEKLRELTDLKGLGLAGTNVTDAGLEKLRVVTGMKKDTTMRTRMGASRKFERAFKRSQSSPFRLRLRIGPRPAFHGGGATVKVEGAAPFVEPERRLSGPDFHARFSAELVPFLLRVTTGD